MYDIILYVCVWCHNRRSTRKARKPTNTSSLATPYHSTNRSQHQSTLSAKVAPIQQEHRTLSNQTYSYLCSIQLVQGTGGTRACERLYGSPSLPTVVVCPTWRAGACVLFYSGKKSFLLFYGSAVSERRFSLLEIEMAGASHNKLALHLCCLWVRLAV